VNKAHDLLINPRFWLWFHAFGAARWLLLFVPGLLLWRDSVPFLMYVSLDTALTGSLAGVGAALAARKADPDDPL
jgi:hypothetical protein